MSNDKITAPFTPEQVECLQAWQDAGFMHPFTCGSPDGCEQPDNGALIPTETGWECPCGKYTQDWAHSYMGKKVVLLGNTDIRNWPLYVKIFHAQKTPVAFYSYPVGTVDSSYIASDDEISILSVMVNKVIVNALSILGLKADNKIAVKCEVEGLDYPIYFVSYDLRRIICTEIRIGDSTEYLIK